MAAAMLIAAQALAPAVAWAQTTRSAAPPVPAAKESAPPAKGSAPPAPAAPAAASPTKGPVVDRRLALVVGNNDYKNAPLVNPINDARLVAKTLEGLGFEVMLRENLNLRDFKAVMRQFASRLENEEGTGLLYYAGHGVQIEGRNFLLPIDVGTGDEYELRDSAVDLEDTLMARLTRARKREKIIILDACRDNPFRAPNQQHRALLLRGFAQMGSEKGSLIVYSTNPGNTAEDGSGKNSIFTEFFVREIQKDAVEVGQALRSVTSAVVGATKGRQTPWYNSSLLGEFYFRPVNVRVEEERRKKEVQQQVELALKTAREDLKRDEAGRIEAAVSARVAERERERQERERQYTAQIAEMKALLERRDKDLDAARVQVAATAKTRDEQVAALATAEAERRRLERERPVKTEPDRPPPPIPDQDDAARKKADAERAAREAREREMREGRDRLIKLEAQRRAADEKSEREEAARQTKAAVEIARREAAAKTQREKDERDRLVQAEAKRKEAEQARREESARQAKAAAEKMRVFEEQARQTAAKDRLASNEAAARDAVPKPQREPDNAEAARLAAAKVKRAKEDAERAIRDAKTSERLAAIEEEVRRKASLEFEMLNRKASLPPELAALMVTEPQKTVVAGPSGDFAVRGVRLPADVAVKSAAPNVPANCAAFLGAWGNGRWNGERSAEIWVESVDPDCRARAIYARGGLGMTGEAASYLRGDARISGERLALELGPVRIELTREGERAAGRWSSGVNFATARFERIPPAPERTVALFANEALDFGARPSRVISASQVGVNERTRVETMLPLPTAVPGIDTLTTVQLDAFLKSHPDTVLLDAMVSGAHRTLPGAYWLPELGVVTIGQKERSQIENTLRTANGGDLTRAIVVFERSSTFGWFGYHGVLRLLGMGYKNIYWYRGGLDAWHDAQFPLAQAEAWAPAR